jgi:hypothetical protein
MKKITKPDLGWPLHRSVWVMFFRMMWMSIVLTLIISLIHYGFNKMAIAMTLITIPIYLCVYLLFVKIIHWLTSEL